MSDDKNRYSVDIGMDWIFLAIIIIFFYSSSNVISIREAIVIKLTQQQHKE